jgi:hypothetical protein
LVAAALLGVAGCGATGDPRTAETDVVLPRFPNPSDLIEIVFGRATDSRFFVDGSSVSIGEDGIVWFAFVVQSASGAKNVTYEGMRCKPAERKIYAVGRENETWSLVRDPSWRSLSGGGRANPYNTLHVDYFCPDGLPIATADEARRRMRAPTPQPTF